MVVGPRALRFSKSAKFCMALNPAQWLPTNPAQWPATDNGSMEPSMEPSSQSHNDKGFEWNPGMMCDKSNIKIGNAEYFHPFSARIGSSQCWNFFRCKVGLDYKSAQDVYCLRCCKKLKSKPEEPIKYSFHTLKWNHGYATSHLMKHINQHHGADITADQKSASAAQSSPQQSKITSPGVPAMSKTHRDSLTKDLVRNLVFEDKEPFSVFERPGFRSPSLFSSGLDFFHEAKIMCGVLSRMQHYATENSR